LVSLSGSSPVRLPVEGKSGLEGAYCSALTRSPPTDSVRAARSAFRGKVATVTEYKGVRLQSASVLPVGELRRRCRREQRYNIQKFLTVVHGISLHWANDWRTISLAVPIQLASKTVLLGGKMPAVSIQAFLAWALAIAVAFTSPVVFARGGGGHSGGHSASHSGGHSRSLSGGSHTSSHNSGASQSHTGTHTAPTRTTSGQHRGTYAQSAQRDSHGRIERSAKAKRDFQKSHPCPSTGRASGACPGYVVDHVTPLKRGGADSPGNMQWQTVQAAKEKDKRE